MASPAREPLTLAGAGLVGSLLSIYLARRGFPVEVLERRPDMRSGPIEAGKSINLAISARGIHALRQVGLADAALVHAIPMRGRMMHAHSGELTFQAYGKDDSQCIHSISRGWLNQMLMTEAERAGVRIRFQQRVTGVDFEGGTLEVRDEPAGTSSTVRASPLFATDGGGSAVRAAMLKRSGFDDTEQLLSHGYKELTIRAGVGGSWRIEKNALHIWPRGTFMLIALPNEDGSFTCTLFLAMEGETSFATLDTPVKVRAFFEREFPDAMPLLDDLEGTFFRNPTGRMGTIKCTPWNVGGRAVLVGDAAHAIVPFYGQGMNCGFEDCVALDALIAEERGWEHAFATFSRSRKPHSDAIADMAVENFIEMRDKVGDPRFLFEKQIEKRLLNAFPGEFVSRYTLVSFSRVPYAIAYRVGELAQGIVSELAEGLTRAEDVDLDRAAKLIHSRLTPDLQETGYGPSTWRT
jgi:kynurenine 3-monooxygenase